MPAELATSLVTTDDDRLLQAEALVRSFCGWHIAPQRQDTVTVHFAGGVAVLPTLHLVSVDRVVTSDGIELDPAYYTASTAGVLRRARPTGWSFTVEPLWSWWDGDATVTFTHGYDQPPADVTAAVVAVAQQAKSAAPGLQSKTTGPFSETYLSTGDALGVQRAALNRYRIPPRA